MARLFSSSIQLLSNASRDLVVPLGSLLPTAQGDHERVLGDNTSRCVKIMRNDEQLRAHFDGSF
eukprot:1854828-Pleurochrysis_carterae.AAC.1